MPERAVCVHSLMKSAEQTDALREFEQGDTRHLVFVSKVSEGYDFPAIDAVVLFRPMRSPTLYIQTVGRGLRLHPDKSDCLVLDYGKVVSHCGRLDRPVVQEDLLVLGDDGKRRAAHVEDKVDYRVVTCDHCGMFNFFGEGDRLTCTHCNGVIVLGYSNVMSLRTTSFTGESLYSSEESAVSDMWRTAVWVDIVRDFRLWVDGQRIDMEFIATHEGLGFEVPVKSTVWMPGAKAKWAMRNSMIKRVRAVFAPLLGETCTYKSTVDKLTYGEYRVPTKAFLYKDADGRFIVRALSMSAPKSEEPHAVSTHVVQGGLFDD
jgi:hypothetical protein